MVDKKFNCAYADRYLGGRYQRRRIVRNSEYYLDLVRFFGGNAVSPAAPVQSAGPECYVEGARMSGAQKKKPGTASQAARAEQNDKSESRPNRIKWPPQVW